MAQSPGSPDLGLEQGVYDVRQSSEVAQDDGMKPGAFDALGHHPSDQVAEQQMGVDFLDDTGTGG